MHDWLHILSDLLMIAGTIWLLIRPGKAKKNVPAGMLLIIGVMMKGFLLLKGIK